MPKKKRTTTAFLVVAALLLAAAAWAGSVWLRIHDDPRLPGGFGDPPAEPDPQQKNIINILILGLDQLGNEPARADSIMVMSVNQDTGDVAVVSIPRDARVDIPGHGLDKINHAMAYSGGITLMKRTVEGLLGVPIHHYVYTNFNGFIKIVDILGGVTVNVERLMVYEDIYFPIYLEPGRQRLNGYQALGYVRYRGDSAGDFGRMRRQQEFLKALAREALQVRTLLVLPKLLEEVARHVRTDMSMPQLLSFSRLAGSVDPDQVAMVALGGRNININGVAYVSLDEAQLKEAVRRYLLWEAEEEEEEQQPS